MIDDQSDYFAVEGNQWLSEKQREAYRKKEEELRTARHSIRRNQTVTLDFAGRQVVEENESAGKVCHMYMCNLLIMFFYMCTYMYMYRCVCAA